MALQRWHERDPHFTEAFLREHRGERAFAPSAWRDAAALAVVIASWAAKLGLLILAMRAFF